MTNTGSSKKKWYCVTSSIDDAGRISAAITDSVEAEEMPDPTYTSTTRKDIYQDWFGSREETEKFVRDSRKESSR